MISTTLPSTPTPSYRRMMVFIDGENLAISYQDSLKKGAIPKSGIIHEPNTYVWHRRTINAARNEVIRATYYTFAVGDDDKINAISNTIKTLDYVKDGMSSLPNNLRPFVFKKSKQQERAKGVDIQITVDILTNVYNNNLDTVYLVTGDGDFLPIINEIIRHGKHVYLAAFSTGLNKKLLNHVDHFIDLDKVYFE